jgi:hypothetical protein
MEDFEKELLHWFNRIQRGDKPTLEDLSEASLRHLESKRFIKKTNDDPTAYVVKTLRVEEQAQSWCDVEIDDIESPEVHGSLPQNVIFLKLIGPGIEYRDQLQQIERDEQRLSIIESQLDTNLLIFWFTIALAIGSFFAGTATIYEQVGYYQMDPNTKPVIFWLKTFYYYMVTLLIPALTVLGFGYPFLKLIERFQ